MTANHFCISRQCRAPNGQTARPSLDSSCLHCFQFLHPLAPRECRNVLNPSSATHFLPLSPPPSPCVSPSSYLFPPPCLSAYLPEFLSLSLPLSAFLSLSLSLSAFLSINASVPLSRRPLPYPAPLQSLRSKTTGRFTGKRPETPMEVRRYYSSSNNVSPSSRSGGTRRSGGGSVAGGGGGRSGAFFPSTKSGLF